MAGLPKDLTVPVIVPEWEEVRNYSPTLGFRTLEYVIRRLLTAAHAEQVHYWAIL